MSEDKELPTLVCTIIEFSLSGIFIFLSLLLSIRGYWRIRGLVQPVRLLLAYIGIEYKEKLYEIGSDLSRNSWLNEKYSLGLELPNLPYWIDPARDINLTQSRALLRHLSREHESDLLGMTPAEQRRIDSLDGHVFDFWTTLINLCYHYSEEAKNNFLESLPKQFEILSNFIGDHQWSVSDNLSFIDFMVYESLYQHKVFLHSINSENVLEGFPILQGFIERFESIPQISEYMNSPNFIKLPLYTRLAKYYI